MTEKKVSKTAQDRGQKIKKKFKNVVFEQPLN